MASAPTSLDPLLVSVKAVDPAKYPFYGDGDAGAGDAACAGADAIDGGGGR